MKLVNSDFLTDVEFCDCAQVGLSGCTPGALSVNRGGSTQSKPGIGSSHL
jgi:hypothetical protein